MAKENTIKKLRFGKGGLTVSESDKIIKQMLLALSVAINQIDIPEIKEILIDIKVYFEDHLLYPSISKETIERPYPERDFIKGLSVKDGKVDFHYFKTCLKDALKKIEKMKPSGYITRRGKKLGIKPNEALLKANKERVKKNQLYLKEEVEGDLEMFKNLVK